MLTLAVRSDTVVTPRGVGAYDMEIQDGRIVAVAAPDSLTADTGSTLRLPAWSQSSIAELCGGLRFRQAGHIDRAGFTAGRPFNLYRVSRLFSSAPNSPMQSVAAQSS
jgi:hypothetical protein